MTAETQELLLGALDAALTQQVCRLFGVLLADPEPADEAAIGRFLSGLNRAVGVHERLVAEIGPVTS